MSEAEKGRDGRNYRQQFGMSDNFTKWKSPYDFDTEEIQWMQQRNISPIWSQVFAVSTAQSPLTPLVLNQPGRAVRITGLTTATAYSLSANTGIETVASSVMVGMILPNNNGLNQAVSDPSEFLILKHGGGFRGDFLNLAFFWPAQSNNSVRITIYRYDGVPWASGDAST